MKVTLPVLTFISLIILCKNRTPVEGERILSVSFFSSQSHKNVYEGLLHELANKGHQITIISPVKGSKNHPNIREITGKTMEEWNAEFSVNFFTLREQSYFVHPVFMIPIFELLCRHYYELPGVRDLVDREKFDLVIASSFMNECTYGLVAHFNTTSIFIHPHAPPSFTSISTGAPSPPSFVPLSMFVSTDRMNFFERVKNTVVVWILTALHEMVYVPKLEGIYRDYLGVDTPSIGEVAKNASLVLMNSHFTLNYPRPLMPDMIDVGGMHCREGQPLPKELDDFLMGSGNDGFIYFSLGSVVKADTMPEKYRVMFINAFSKLKQRVIWKWENEKMDNLPNNVLLRKWLPQQDILAHPKIKLFLTHGGLLSTEEAVYHGVPLVGMPIFADQDWNMKNSEANGFALTLELTELTEENILEKINTILNDNRYRERIQALSKVFKDRPQKPMETALYWVEYVMRHKGAIHLRSPARDLNIFQYHSVDVIAFVALCLTSLMFVLVKLVKLSVGALCTRNQKCTTVKTKAARKKKHQ